MLTIGSLFAGIGGLDLGFELAGFETRWQVELDPYAAAAYAATAVNAASAAKNSAADIMRKHYPKPPELP